MNNEYVNALRKQVKKVFKGNKKRYWHTIGVADTCACLAMRYEEDLERAYIAGLLHDCAKCLSGEMLVAECEKKNIPITESEYQSPYLLHAKLGAYCAKHCYGIQDEGICNAIRFHTVGRPGMTILEEIVFLADYMEPFRNEADHLDEIRRIAFKDLSLAVYKVTQSTIECLKSQNRMIDHETVRTCAYYRKQTMSSDTFWL